MCIITTVVTVLKTLHRKNVDLVDRKNPVYGISCLKHILLVQPNIIRRDTVMILRIVRCYIVFIL